MTVATQPERELERLLKQERAHSERLEKKLDELLARVDEQQKQIRDLLASSMRRCGWRRAKRRRLRGELVLGGCNRSRAHASAHAVLASVAQTAHRQGSTLTDFVRGWLRPAARLAFPN